MGLAVVGVAIGIASAFALSRLIETPPVRRHGARPGGVRRGAAVLTVVALLAVWLPALRATRIDPIDALRYE